MQIFESIEYPSLLMDYSIFLKIQQAKMTITTLIYPKARNKISWDDSKNFIIKI